MTSWQYKPCPLCQAVRKAQAGQGNNPDDFDVVYCKDCKQTGQVATTLAEKQLWLAEQTMACPAIYKYATWNHLTCKYCEGTLKVPLLPGLRQQCWCQSEGRKQRGHQAIHQENKQGCQGRGWVVNPSLEALLVAWNKAYLEIARDQLTLVVESTAIAYVIREGHDAHFTHAYKGADRHIEAAVEAACKAVEAMEKVRVVQ